jgi:tetratricopeptide (TPR) repeat protein
MRTAIVIVLLACLFPAAGWAQQSKMAKQAEAQKLSDAGQELFANGDTDRAIAKEREAISLDPDLTIAHSVLGDMLRWKNDWDGALKEYHEVFRLEPDNAGDHNGAGEALEFKGDLQGAVVEYRKARALDPNNDQYKFDYDNLLKKLNPSLQTPTEQAQQAADAGAGLFGKKDYDGAIAKLSEALRLQPDLEVAHLYLAAALASKRDWDNALNEYREVLRLEPNNVTAHLGLGYVLAWKNDWDGAVKEDREVLSLEPNNGDAHHQLGEALEGKGDQKGALEEYRAACALDPKSIEFQSHFDSLQEKMREVRPIDDALREAAKSGDVNRVLNLLDQGAGIDATNKEGETALMWASYWGQTEVVDILIRKKANVNAKANESEGNGDTALTLAVNAALAPTGSWDTVVMNSKGDLPGWESRHLAVVKLLVNWGADVNAANLFGESALNMAYSRPTGQPANKYNLDFLEVLIGGMLPPPPPEFQ